MNSYTEPWVTTLLTTITPPAQSTITATFSWTGMSVGSHALSAKVTDSQASVTTSATTTVQVLAAPTINLSTLSNYTLAGASVDLNTAAGVDASATIAKVEFIADNGASNALIGNLSAPPNSAVNTLSQ